MSRSTARLTAVGRIREELGQLRAVVERVARIWGRAYQSDADDYFLDAVALNLHGFYAGIEQLLMLIADTVDESRPEGPDWHRSLLRQMCADIPDVRPAVLDHAACQGLDRFRGFRHVVRNVYAYNLDADQIGLLVAALPVLFADVDRQLSAFADWLESATRSKE